MAKQKVHLLIESVRSYVFQRGWAIVGEKTLQHGFQLIITDGITRVPIDCYNNGNALIQGPIGVLKTELQAWWQQQKSSSLPETLF